MEDFLKLALKFPEFEGGGGYYHTEWRQGRDITPFSPPPTPLYVNDRTRNFEYTVPLSRNARPPVFRILALDYQTFLNELKKKV